MQNASCKNRRISMLKIEQKKLTSNSLINKLLLRKENTSLTYILATLCEENRKNAVTKEDIHTIVYDIFHLDEKFDKLNTMYKVQLIRLGVMIDRFKDDKDIDICIALASQGHYLNKLTHSPYPCVRTLVAQHKCNLDILIHDPDPDVRKAAQASIDEDFKIEVNRFSR